MSVHVKCRIIKEHLLVLLHTYKCLDLDNEPAKRKEPCRLPHCVTFKTLFTHIILACKGDSPASCPEPHCKTSRLIISHWRNCSNPCCSICDTFSYLAAVEGCKKEDLLPEVPYWRITKKTNEARSKEKLKAGGSKANGSLKANGIHKTNGAPRPVVASPKMTPTVSFKTRLTLSPKGSCSKGLFPATERQFTAKELKTHLRPVWMILHKASESAHIRKPVDYFATPEYYEVIKLPMDLSMVLRKLEEGVYKNPWEFCVDVYLVFDNAWRYHDEKSKTYKNTNKLHEMFIEEVNPAMRALGYCCGERVPAYPPGPNEFEPLEQCTSCRRRWHTSCTAKASSAEPDSEGFQCGNCREGINTESAGAGVSSTRALEDEDEEEAEPVATASNWREEQLRRCVSTLVHAANCKVHGCDMNCCTKMKDVIVHNSTCREQENACYQCKQLIVLSIRHSKECSNRSCQVPYCVSLRTKFHEQPAYGRRMARRTGVFVTGRRG
ncbi:hypothetical protein L596_024343 [Steinernema carpocapsae]|uniref:histone acetyltransferase n=1 Tax=Steinernema carpocapsae TaxID=34508 RepID=A0A4U5MGG8_STECR|nr:hypothetical protein L596_024343 [Steinernema carpocapsae]